MNPCATCPGPDYCERCPTCGLCTGCRCEPELATAHGLEGSCENCGRLVNVDEKIHLWDDDVVTHVECPEGAQA